MAPTRPRADLTELGSSGLFGSAGYLAEDILRELRGPKWIQAVREMTSNDAIVGGILLAIELLARQVDWRVEAASADADTDPTVSADGARQFVEECFDDMSQTWPDTLSEILTMLPWGWTMLEVVLKVRGGDAADPEHRSQFNDGRIGWRKWAIRAQESLHHWQFDDSGGIQGMWQLAAPAYRLILLPIEKCLLFRTSTHKGNPEGHSILRSAYRAWRMKTNIENIEGIGVERDLAGLPEFWVPAQILSSNRTAADQAMYDRFESMAVNLRKDEQSGVIMPLEYDDKGNKLYDFKLASTGGARQIDTNTIINRYDQRIAASVLADFLLLGSRSQGSFALSTDKTDLFSKALGAWLDTLCQVVNRFAIPRLCRLNGIAQEDYPSLAHGPVEDISLADLGAYMQQLSMAGFPLFPNGSLEAALLERAHLPTEDLVDPDDRPEVPTLPTSKDSTNQDEADATDVGARAASEWPRGTITPAAIAAARAHWQKVMPARYGDLLSATASTGKGQ